MDKENTGAIRRETEAALERILGRLGSFAVSNGLSVSQLEQFLRSATVRQIMKSVDHDSTSKSVSRISALTGLSRTAVSEIMRSGAHTKPVIQLREKYTNRVLAAWHRDPKYIDRDGLPRSIPIYGRGNSFERLTRIHGGGIPVRAMLDELLRISAVKALPNQHVKAVKLVAVSQGNSIDMIRSIGLKVEDLVGSLMYNARAGNNPRFVASVESAHVPVESLALIRREVAHRGAAFVSELEESLFVDSRSPLKRSRGRTRRSCRAGFAVFYFEDAESSNNTGENLLRRKNLRRI